MPWHCPPALMERIAQIARLPQTPVSLRQMVEFGKQPNAGTLLRATQFLREELPIRLAHRVVELENAPHNLAQMPSVGLVKNWYAQSFQDLVEFPTPEQYGIDRALLSQADELRPRRSAPRFHPALGGPSGAAADAAARSPAFETPPETAPLHQQDAMWRVLFGPGADGIETPGAAGPPPPSSPADSIWSPPATAQAPAGPSEKSELMSITAGSNAPLGGVRPSGLSAGPPAAAKEFTSYYTPMRSRDYAQQVLEYSRQFVECIETVKRRHDPTMTTMALGVLEAKELWKQSGHPIYAPDPSGLIPLPVSLRHFLDRFYMSRIGIRMLIGQHMALVRPPAIPHGDYVGIICTRTNLYRVAQQAIDDARAVCQEHFGLFDAPPVRFIGSTNTEFMYVPSHLHHMLFELLKNSLRAIVERFGIDCEEWPEIRLIAAEGKEDITIKISDEGGGIPRSGMPLVWTYMYTTANKPQLSEGDFRSDFRAPLAGFGYGLPLSRLYARYFGGDLRLVSMESYGTDAYLHLNRLSDSEEPLP